MAIVLQSALFTGSLAEGLKMENLGAVATGMALGKAALVRAGAAGAAFVLLLLLSPGPLSWIGTAALGLVATVGLAWMGHGAAGEGPTGWIQLTADILHLIAAAVWIGALLGLLKLLVVRPQTEAAADTARSALERFSGIGSAIVAVLLLTGVINGWVLIGPDRLDSLWTSPYGRLLLLKVLLFGGMLVLAASNRFRLTPGLGKALHSGEETGAALGALRRSIALELALGIAILALVAWLGVLAPPASA